MIRKLSALLLCLCIIGCATTKPSNTYKYIENISDLLRYNITVDKSMKTDVIELLGQPDIRSVGEGSSIEIPEVPEVPLLDQLNIKMDFDIIPYETWTYIHVKDPKDVDDGRFIQVLGVSVFGKDLKTTTILFNKEGRVLGYQVIAHYVN